jgi:Icc-related predicted phosphoesterase
MVCKITSDLHGFLPEITDPFDLLIIAGDITPATRGFHSKKVQKDWVLNKFKTWIDKLPYKDVMSRVFIVPGNHDFVFEELSTPERLELESTLGFRCKLLIHEEITFKCEFKHIRIFGTPYCKIFGTWAFMHDNDYLKEKYNQIPKGLDILISHDPPTLCDLGKIHQGWNQGVQAGNSLLAERILEIKPKYVFAGHIHSGNHNLTEYQGIQLANVSISDEHYDPVYPILTIEL